MSDSSIFSRLCHIKTHHLATPPQNQLDELKRIPMLANITLLLVNKEQGDVAAVSMRIKKHDPSVALFLEEI